MMTDEVGRHDFVIIDLQESVNDQVIVMLGQTFDYDYG